MQSGAYHIVVESTHRHGSAAALRPLCSIRRPPFPAGRHRAWSIIWRRDGHGRELGFGPGKSTLTHPDPQALVDEKAGTGQQVGNRSYTEQGVE